jgi:hypothetical protein
MKQLISSKKISFITGAHYIYATSQAAQNVYDKIFKTFGAADRCGQLHGQKN